MHRDHVQNNKTCYENPEKSIKYEQLNSLHEAFDAKLLFSYKGDMERTVKERLCWNCDGGVSFEAEHCPFCGVYLSPLSPEESLGDAKPSLTTFDSPWHTASVDKETEPTDTYEEEKDRALLSQKEEVPLSSSSIPSLVFLLPGTTLFFFGLSLFFMADEGKLVLSWKSDLSLPLLLISSALLFFGSKRAS